MWAHLEWLYRSVKSEIKGFWRLTRNPKSPNSPALSLGVEAGSLCLSWGSHTRSCTGKRNLAELDLPVWGNRAKVDSGTVWPYLPSFCCLLLVFPGKICPLIPLGKPGVLLLLFSCLFKKQDIMRSSGKVGGIQISPSPPRKDNWSAVVVIL